MTSLLEKINLQTMVDDAQLESIGYDSEERCWNVVFNFGDEEYGASIEVRHDNCGELYGISQGVGRKDNQSVTKSLIRMCEDRAVEFVRNNI